MRLSTSTNIYFNRPGGRKGSLDQCIRFCGQGGYKRMDLNLVDYTNFRFPFVGGDYQKWIGQAMETAALYGITFGQAHAPFYNFCDPLAEGREELDALILRSIDCAQTMGIPWVAIHAGTDFEAAEPRRSSLEKNRAYFLPVLEYAEKRNVGIAFENLWDLNIAPRKRYTASVEDLIELVDSFPCSNAGICFDVEHAAISRQDPAKLTRLIGKRLKATHISDYLDMRANHLLPFSGPTEWEPFMAALRDIGYAGDFAFEIQHHTEFLPDELVPSAVRHSLEVGTYLLRLAEKRPKEEASHE